MSVVIQCRAGRSAFIPARSLCEESYSKRLGDTTTVPYQSCHMHVLRMSRAGIVYSSSLVRDSSVLIHHTFDHYCAHTTRVIVRQEQPNYVGKQQDYAERRKRSRDDSASDFSPCPDDQELQHQTTTTLHILSCEIINHVMVLLSAKQFTPEGRVHRSRRDEAAHI